MDGFRDDAWGLPDFPIPPALDAALQLGLAPSREVFRTLYDCAGDGRNLHQAAPVG
jgi:hypothetical protein